MMRSKPLVRFLKMAALALGCGLILTATLQRAFNGEQENRQAGNAEGRERGTTTVPNLSDLKPPPSEVQGMIERYTVDRGSLTRSFPTEMSPVRRTRLKQFYEEWRATLGRLDFDGLGQDDRVDYLLFKNHLDYELRQLDIQAQALAETAPLIPFAQSIIELDDARRRMEPVDSPQAAALLNQLNKQIEAARRGVEAELKTQRPAKGDAGSSHGRKTVAYRAADRINDLRNVLRTWFSFYNGYDPVFTWWMDAPYKQADQALQSYAAFLREKIVGLKAEANESDGAPPAEGPPSEDRPFRGPGAAGGPPPGGRPPRGSFGERAGRAGAAAKAGSSADIIGYPIGRDALLGELAHEMIPYTPEELIAIANQEFAWCEGEMKKAARALGYGDDWLKALEHVKTLYVEPGKQPALIRDLALEAIQFLDDHDLVTVPPLARESWRMAMMSPERQLVNPFFTGGETISVSYPTSGMSHEQKLMSMRGNNIHFARATVFHELIPGHHLQGFMTARYRPYRGLFGTPFWGEGWALYWELLLWDMNFPKTPENRIGMLFWRMHRCARIIFSLSFHLGKMTPQECIDFLVQRVGHEPENATAEVRRSFGGGYGPLYQAAYLLGGLQFYALHKELVDSGRMTNRAFHDAILKENRISVEMVRALLTRPRLTRDFTSSWKFYGPNPGGR